MKRNITATIVFSLLAITISAAMAGSDAGKNRYFDMDYSPGTIDSSGNTIMVACVSVGYYKSVDAGKIEAHLRRELQSAVDLYEPNTDVLAKAFDRDGRAYAGVKSFVYSIKTKKIDALP